MKLTNFQKTLLVTALSSVLMTHVQASTVREDIDYQTYRDFAENKGVFVAGATNIDIKDKTGKSLGPLFAGNIAMPDFSSSLVNTGTATLVDPQFMATAMHNGEDVFANSARPIQFGNQYGYKYNVVDINYAENLTTAEVDAEEDIRGKYKDFGAPRLNKLVTEVVPQAYLNQDRLNARELNLSDYSAFARVGSGIQRVTNGAGEPTMLNDAYDYLTGGSLMAFKPTIGSNTGGGKYIESQADFTEVVTPDGVAVGLNNQVYHYNDAMKTHFADGRPVSSSPLITMTEQGDSGSGLLGYNRNTNRWELIGVLHGGFQVNDKDGNPLASDTYAVFDKDAYDTIKGRYIGLDNMGGNLTWSLVGNNSYFINGAVANHLDKGKDVYFTQDATVALTQNIDQGSGAIKVGYQPIANMTTTTPARTVTFRSDNGDNRTWLGAGLDIATGSTVNWQVHNPEDDRLSKIGAGTLNVNGKGENLGDISVGDGLVILAQQADAGKKQAFKNVEITSGRGTVRLTDNQQMNLDNLTFGYRGGRLDLNGVQNLSTHSIKNVDDGGLIVNHSDQKASLVWLGEKQLPARTPFSFVTGADGNAYRPKTEASLFYNPTRENSLHYEYLSGNFETGNATQDNQIAEQARANYVNQLNRVNLITTFAGHLGEKADSGKKNGQIDFTYRPEDRPQESTLLLTGGSNLNGQLIAESGRVVMSGRPTPHALDYAKQQEVVKDDDWINRSYTATSIQAKNDAKVYIGRNVSNLNANINASGMSKVQLGFVQNSTPVCVRSDYNFEESCDVKTYNSTVLNSMPTTQAKGDVSLADSAELEIGRSHLVGKIQATANSKTNLQADAKWTLTGDSQVGNLALTQGAVVQLNNATDANSATKYNTLNVLGNLTGAGQFNYLTNISKFTGDKVVVNGNNDATLRLLVQDTGLEPQKTKEHLTLLSVKGTDRGSVALANANQRVDLGAYRYSLQKEGNDYRLWSPNLEQEIDNQANQTAQAINNAKTQVNTAVSNAEKALADAQQALTNAERDQLDSTAINNAKAEVAKAQQAVNDAKSAQTAVNSATTVENANRALAQATAALGVTTAVVTTVNNIFADAKAKADAEAKAKAEAEAKAKAEAEAKAKAEAEAKAKAEAEAKAKAEAEAKAKADAEAKAKAEAEAKAKAEAEAKAKAEAEAKAKAEAEAKAKAEAEAKAKAEAEAKAKAEAEAKAKAEAEAKAKAEAEAKAKAEQARIQAINEAKARVNTAVSNAEKALADAKAALNQAEQNNADANRIASAKIELAKAEKAVNDAKLAQTAVNNATTADQANTASTNATTAETTARNSLTAINAILANQSVTPVNQADVASRYTNAALSELSAQAISLQNINRGLTRQILFDDARNVWLESNRTKATVESTQHRAYNSYDTLTQVGVKKQFEQEHGKLTVGGVYSHNQADQYFDDAIDNDAQLDMLHLYGRYQFNNQAFVSVDAGYGRSKNEMTSAGEKQRFSRNLATAGVNLGKTWQTPVVNIQPSVGVRFDHLAGQQYMINQAKAQVEDANLLSYRAGVNLSKPIVLSTGVTITPAISADYVKTTSDAEVVMNDQYRFTQNFGDHTYSEASIDIGYQNWGVELKGAYADGKNMSKQQSGGLKISYKW